jgi:hypothetical protein
VLTRRPRGLTGRVDAAGLILRATAVRQSRQTRFRAMSEFFPRTPHTPAQVVPGCGGVPMTALVTEGLSYACELLSPVPCGEFALAAHCIVMTLRSGCTVNWGGSTPSGMAGSTTSLAQESWSASDAQVSITCQPPATGQAA